MRNKILLNPVLRFMPSRAAKRSLKVSQRCSTEGVKQRYIKTEDQLPSEEHVHGKTDTK
jgi:hypothetical protein